MGWRAFTCLALLAIGLMVVGTPVMLQATTDGVDTLAVQAGMAEPADADATRAEPEEPAQEPGEQSEGMLVVGGEEWKEDGTREPLYGDAAATETATAGTRLPLDGSAQLGDEPQKEYVEGGAIQALYGEELDAGNAATADGAANAAAGEAAAGGAG